MTNDLLKLIKPIMTLIFSLVVLWIIGLFLFVNYIPKNDTEIPINYTDAIVVLTGGPLRIEEGLSIFPIFKSKKLLISGVGEGVTIKDLTQSLKNKRYQIDIRENDIILGTLAKSTLTNAYETKIFMNLYNLNSLRLVTSNYHIPRSKLIFDYVLANKLIIYHPIFNSNFKYSKDSLRNLNIIVSEYIKYSTTLFFITFEKMCDYWDGIMFKIANFIKLSYENFVNYFI